MKYISFIIIIFFALMLTGCKQGNNTLETAPNIILIMADDMGYECLSCNSSTSYQTPELDKLAKTGIRFTHCIAQPLCTPSRVKIMTGQYNYRNYEYFGYLNPRQRTFAQVMKEADYKTCISGKWQLNGLSYELEGYRDNTRPYQLGFDEYCLWQLTHTRNEGERYAHPLIEKNGEFLQVDSADYGPDIFRDFVIDFIERNQENRFFIYYPMVLVHEPFVPTPDSPEWTYPGRRYEKDTANFKDMMAYTDKIIGQIRSKLEELDLFDNTLFIFTADNGTARNIISYTTGGPVKGGKGMTIDAGTRVPLVISWPAKIQMNEVYRELIEFSDFYPTFAEIAGKDESCDGISFLPLLKGENYVARRTAYVYYDPQWGEFVNQFRGQFARTRNYKLYKNGKFYNLEKDILEKSPLHFDQLTNQEQETYEKLKQILDSKPPLPVEIPE